MPNLFNPLSLEQKIDFFIKCQSLLLKYHPDSSFLARLNNVEEIVDRFYENINKYRGFYYTDENICILWNFIKVTDPNNVNQIITENTYKDPNPEFNGVSIDFAVFREIKFCLDFINKHNDPLIKYILFIREGKPKLYKKEDLLKNIG